MRAMTGVVRWAAAVGRTPTRNSRPPAPIRTSSGKIKREADNRFLEYIFTIAKLPRQNDRRRRLGVWKQCVHPASMGLSKLVGETPNNNHDRQRHEDRDLSETDVIHFRLGMGVIAVSIGIIGVRIVTMRVREF